MYGDTKADIKPLSLSPMPNYCSKPARRKFIGIGKAELSICQGKVF